MDNSIFEKVEQIGKKLRTHAKRSQDIIITGVKIKENTQSFICNIALTEEGTHVFSSHLFDKSFSGTGDLFSSAMCGLRLNGYSTKEAMDIAGNFLYHSISDTMNAYTNGNDGIFFEKHLSELIKYVY